MSYRGVVVECGGDESQCIDALLQGGGQLSECQHIGHMQRPVLARVVMQVGPRRHVMHIPLRPIGTPP